MIYIRLVGRRAARLPGRLGVLVDLDSRLALDTCLPHSIAQLGASEEFFGVGRGGETVHDEHVVGVAGRPVDALAGHTACLLDVTEPVVGLAPYLVIGDVVLDHCGYCHGRPFRRLPGTGWSSQRCSRNLFPRYTG